MLSRYLNRCGYFSLRYQQPLPDAVSRTYTTRADSKSQSEGEVAQITLENARRFEDIPGPSKFQFLRGLLPGGEYYKQSVTDMVILMSKKYGTLFRLPGMFGQPDTYISLNPLDYEVIFRNEGPWPMRKSFDSMTYYREVYKRDFFEGKEGILSTSGKKWFDVRSAVNPILLQPKNAKLYLNTLLEVNDEFLARIRDIRDPVKLEVPDTFEDDINRLTFESVAAIALNTQLGLIRKNRDTPEAKTILYNLKRVFDLAFDLDVMPSIWKIIKTPKFYEMMHTLDTLFDICNKYINEALVRIEHDTEGKLTSEAGKEKSVLEKLVRVDKKIAVVMALDMMMAGVDTTSSTLTGILLCLAKNPEKQQILFDELKQLLPEKNTRFTLENMKSLPYLRACIKEGIRYYPIMPGTVRQLPQDVVLSGYVFKKGSDVAIGSNLLLRDERYVPCANEFLPERWLRDTRDTNKLSGEILNAFMYLPFGFGPRSCAGIRIANLELEITVGSLIRNFNMEYNYSVDNAFRSKFINVPNIPLKFKFEERLE